MLLLNTELIVDLATRPHFKAKKVFNENGEVVFSARSQHREHKGPGISYEDDYKGNAPAAMLGPGRGEIRYHNSFTDAKVAAIFKALLERPELAFMREWSATYQGRALKLL